MSIYKLCDIRGIYGSELKDRHAERLGRAIAVRLGSVPVLVAGDGRSSTAALKQALIKALIDGGCSVIDLGLVPTPAFFFAREVLGILPGVIITASHNPPADNGFKVILGRLPVKPEEMSELAAWMESQSQMTGFPKGTVIEKDILPEYMQFLQHHTPRLEGMRIVVDCANGMTCLTAHEAWKLTGAEVIFMNDVLDCTYPNHSPNPAVTANLADLSRKVVSLGADLGVAYDGDGDRAGFVDGRGRVLQQDKAIVLFIERLLSENKGPVIYDQKCSRIVPDTIRRLGGEPVMERSDHNSVMSTYLSLNAPYAGEISGHHFFKGLKEDDCLITSFIMGQIIHDSGCSLADLSGAIVSYPITPDIRLKMDSSVARLILAELEAGMEGKAEITRLDGLRVEMVDGWGLARLSVTEQMLTLRFEAISKASLRQIIAQFIEASPHLEDHFTLPDEADIDVENTD
jgi:phosphomannomutase / phosphoglucomutase